MNKRFNKISLTVFFLVFIGAPLCAKGSYKFQKEFKKTYDAKPGMEMSVSNRNGKIEIEKWDKDQVEIFASVGTNKSMEELDKIDVDVFVDENIVIKTKYPGYKSKETKEKSCDEEDFSFWDLIKKMVSSTCGGSKASVDYEIKVPDYLVVAKAASTNGEVTLKGTKGPSTAVTTNGKISAFDIEGDINAKTTNGRIEIENGNGFVSAVTTNGKIKVKSEGIRHLTTTNGSIEAEIKKIKEENIKISTTNGSIKLRLPSSLNAVLELSTTNGGIDLEEITLEVISKHKKKYIKGKMGKGGPEINASTTNGSIKVRKL